MLIYSLFTHYIILISYTTYTLTHFLSPSTPIPQTLTAKMSMRIKRCCGDWIEYVTEAGLVFYYNDRDGSFQWEHPLGEAYARPQPQQQQDKKTAGTIICF